MKLIALCLFFGAFCFSLASANPHFDNPHKPCNKVKNKNDMMRKCSIADQVACHGKGCIKTIKQYDKWVKPNKVLCHSTEFHEDKCYVKKRFCMPCNKEKLPPYLANQKGPTGVGFLCQLHDRNQMCCTPEKGGHAHQGCNYVP